MFYNSRRITKSFLKEIKNNPLSNEGKKTVDCYQKLKDLKEKEKIQDCLLARYIRKSGIKQPQKIFGEEINDFMKNKRLRKIDLNRINIKISNILQKQKSNSINKVMKSSPDIFETSKNTTPPKLTEINHKSTLSLRKKLLNPIENKINTAISNKILKPNLSQNIIKSEENSEENIKNKNCVTMGSTINNNLPKKNLIKKKIFLKPEEELAKLEKELGLEQESENRQKRYERFYKYFSEGNEWEAIYKYNNDIYQKELEEEKRKKFVDKILLREELEKQIKEKEIKNYKEYLENEKFKKYFNEHNNKMELLDREKEEEKIKKLNMEKMTQQEQMKTRKLMQRLELLREKKFDKNMINNIKIELEKEKKVFEEQKLKNYLEMKKIMKETENLVNQKKLEKIRQKEQAQIYYQDAEKNEIKKEKERTKILNKIKSVGDYSQNEKTKKILEKMQKDFEEEEEKLKQYLINKKKLEDLKEEENKKRKIQIRKEIKQYLDKQVEEKKKEKEFEKMLMREQGRIWNIDSERYQKEQQLIEEKIKKLGLKNGEILRQQIEYNKKRKMKKNSMSPTEYSINKNEINKIIDNMEKEQIKEK